MLESALWFFSGALLYRALSTIITVSVSRRIIQESYDYLTILCDAVDEDFQIALNKKREWLEESQLSDREKNRVYRDDNTLRREWQAVIISKLVVSIPNRYFSIKKHLLNTDSTVRLKELKDVLEKLKK
jgi:hypothetical protein